MALFVDQQLTLGALETLPTQAPDSIVAVGTEGPLKCEVLFLLETCENVCPIQLCEFLAKDMNTQ